jgi:hypothetical protein
LQEREIDLAVTHVDAPSRPPFRFRRALEAECPLVEVGGRVDVLHRQRDVADACCHGLASLLNRVTGRSVPAPPADFHG